MVTQNLLSSRNTELELKEVDNDICSSHSSVGKQQLIGYVQLLDFHGEISGYLHELGSTRMARAMEETRTNVEWMRRFSKDVIGWLKMKNARR